MTRADIQRRVRELLTIKQLAERYGIPEATWRYWRATGRGPAAIVLGPRKLLYDAEVVERWLDAHAEPEGA